MTVLVVDDESAVRGVLTRSISAAGHYVLEAATGVEAAQMARSFHGPIHLAVVDQTLEDRKPGIEVAAELATIHPGIRLLLISGHLEEEVRRGLPRTPIHVEFLQKPFAPVVLLDKIRHMLADYNKSWST